MKLLLLILEELKEGSSSTLRPPSTVSDISRRIAFIIFREKQIHPCHISNSDKAVILT